MSVSEPREKGELLRGASQNTQVNYSCQLNYKITSLDKRAIQNQEKKASEPELKENQDSKRAIREENHLNSEPLMIGKLT